MIRPKADRSGEIRRTGGRLATAVVMAVPAVLLACAAAVQQLIEALLDFCDGVLRHFHELREIACRKAGFRDCEAGAHGAVSVMINGLGYGERETKRVETLAAMCSCVPLAGGRGVSVGTTGFRA